MTRTLGTRQREQSIVAMVADGSRFDSHNLGNQEVSTMNLTDGFKVFGLNSEFTWMDLELSMRFLVCFECV